MDYGVGVLLVFLLACGPELVDSPVTDEASCTIAPVSMDFPSGEATNRVAWSLSGGAATVSAEASWYDGGVVAQTTYTIPEAVEASDGIVSFLPYATELDLQEVHGAEIALSLTALDADGQSRCSWSGSMPFFTPEWSGGRAMSTFSVSDSAAMDASLSDTYLLAPMIVNNGKDTRSVQINLYSAVGDVVGLYTLHDSEQDYLPSGTDLRQGEVHLLTEGVPGLTISSHCRIAADSGEIEDCTETDALMHHGLFVSDSGATGFSTQWQEEEGLTALSLPVQMPLDDEASPEVILDVGALFDVTFNYENSFTRSPPGADGTIAACSTNHLSFSVEDTIINAELGICYGFTGEEILVDQVDVIVSDSYAQTLYKRLDGVKIPFRVLPGHDLGVNSTDFIHDLKRVRLADRHRVFVYNLGQSSPVQVLVFDFPDGEETTLRCTAELPDDQDTLFYGSVVLPRADSAVFGAYAATSAMDLRWYDVDTCTEVAAMLSEGDLGGGQWMTPVSAADLYRPGEMGRAAVSSHQVTYSTANWSTD
ncbi:MAG: hypothetical protein ACI8RZ_005236 [Myxococcota bacterium]